MASLASRRPGGLHLYYRDRKRRGNARVKVLQPSIAEAYGELRSGSGYLINWRGSGGWHQLAEGLRNRRGVPFPAEAFEAVRPGGVVKAKGKRNAAGPVEYAASAADVPALETVRPGARNVALFDSVRFWAYSQPKGRDVAEWVYSVEAYALEANGRFPEPLTEREALDTGYSVASWVWSAPELDHTPRRKRGEAASPAG